MIDPSQAVDRARAFNPAQDAQKASPPRDALKGGFRGVESADAFVQRWRPPAYIVDGILSRGRVQALTAYTGHCKTITALHLAICVATGRPFGYHDTEQGAVLFLAGENPDLVAGQFYAACIAAGVRPTDLPIHFHHGRFSMNESGDTLRREAEQIENLALIVPDTHQAFFEGDNDNDNVQALAAAQTWRPLTEMPTQPTVLIPCHPSGKRPDRDNLVPRGGSAFLNELDGNLCLWHAGDTVTLHWAGKHRGPGFEPINFKLDLIKAPEIADAHGREISMPVIRPLLEAERAAAKQEALSVKVRTLRALRDTPNITVSELGNLIDRSKSRAGQVLQTLEQDGLIQKHARIKKLTEAGRKVLEDGASDP